MSEEDARKNNPYQEIPFPFNVLCLKAKPDYDDSGR
jgi:hypothetical protein